MSKKILTGKVISNKQDKTIVVLVERKFQHRFLGKVIKAKKNILHMMKKISLKLAIWLKYKNHDLILNIKNLRF